MANEFVAFKGEMWLLGWKETHNGGATVTFQLSDPEELEAFKKMTVSKGKVAGQRFACVLVEIQDDETPINQNNKRRIEKEELIKGGPLSKRAGILCNDSDYLGYLILHKHITKGEKKAMVEAAEVYVRNMCGVTTRKMLDHDKEAGHKFRTFVLSPFLEAYANDM